MEFSPIIPYIIAILVLVGLFGAFLFYQIWVKKELQLITPNGGETLRAGESYTITWKARKIETVDILLVKEEEPRKSKPIVKNFPAKNRKYQWQIFSFEETSDRYKIAICESPCKERNLFDYSNGYFSIIGPKFVSCEQLEIENNWPFIPSDYPNLKRVFITRGTYRGNLKGLEGADSICQKEAEERKLEGNWKAFLGDEKISAVERLNLEGIFVFAESQDGLPQDKIPAYFWESFKNYLQQYASGNEKVQKMLLSAHETLTRPFSQFYEKWNVLQKNKSCLRFLGKNFDEFYKNFFLSSRLIIENTPEGKFVKDFFSKPIWVGRVFSQETKNCIEILSSHQEKTPFSVSFSPTCQNWTSEKERIDSPTEEERAYLRCYVGGTAAIEALGIGGLARIVKITDNILSSEIVGQHCIRSFHLLCVEQ